jgi:hypothetical protein
LLTYSSRRNFESNRVQIKELCIFNDCLKFSSKPQSWRLQIILPIRAHLALDVSSQMWNVFYATTFTACPHVSSWIHTTATADASTHATLSTQLGLGCCLFTSSHNNTMIVTYEKTPVCHVVMVCAALNMFSQALLSDLASLTGNLTLRSFNHSFNQSFSCHASCLHKRYSDRDTRRRAACSSFVAEHAVLQIHIEFLHGTG